MRAVMQLGLRLAPAANLFAVAALLCGVTLYAMRLLWARITPAPATPGGKLARRVGLLCVDGFCLLCVVAAALGIMTWR